MVTSDGMPVQPQIQIPDGATAHLDWCGRHGVSQVAGQAETDRARPHRNRALCQSPPGFSQSATICWSKPLPLARRRSALPGEEGRGSLRSGALEGSNVNVVEELVDMIETQRAYEVNSKMIQATDEMMRNATQNL